MIAKLIIYGEDRDSCIARLERALGEFVVEGDQDHYSFLSRNT
mgnify:CR=1 FL=1